MKSSKFYTEERSVVVEEMEALVSVAELEKRDLLDEEKKTFDDLNEKAEGLKADAERALKLETMKANTAKNVPSEEETVKRSYSFLKHIEGIASGKLDGVEKEVQEQAVSEARANGRSIQGAGIPASMFEKRADLTSNIPGLSVEAFVDAIREEAVYSRLGADFYNLTSDARIPIIGKQSVAWATENGTAADGGAAFTSVTLSPKRIAGFVNLSRELLQQNGQGVETAIMGDLGRAVGDAICDAMFSAANVTNAPDAISTNASINTFTETAAFASGVSMFADLTLAEQAQAEAEALNGNLAYVLHPTFLSQLKTAAQVSGVNPGMVGMNYNQQMVNGYPVYYSSHCGANAGVSADGIFADWSNVKVGMFGGVDIIVDPYTNAADNQVRLVCNTMIDLKIAQGARATKFTSLTA